MSKCKNKIPKGFKIYRMENGDAVVVNSKSGRATFCYYRSYEPMRNLQDLYNKGWPIKLLNPKWGETIVAQIVE